MKPAHTHDCDECVLLGRMEKTLTVQPNFIPSDEEQWEQVLSTDIKQEIDLYFCDKNGLTRKTVIARFSSEGPDYVSGILFAEADPYLSAAKNLAVAKGLL